MQDLPQTERTRLRRLPFRGHFDFETIAGILDESLLCHVSAIIDGVPSTIPTTYGREGRWLYLHGARRNRTFQAMLKGPESCVTVTLLDGLVLARSAYHHSMNFRSVVIYGQAEELRERPAKIAALRRITEHVIPGRWEEVRAPTDQEIDGTLVLRLPLEEASAKIRVGPPEDDEADYASPAWAGVVPIQQRLLAAVPDPKMRAGIEMAESVRRLCSKEEDEGGGCEA